MIVTGTQQCGVRKTWLAEIWDRLSTPHWLCVTEPKPVKPVGEASRAGKLPQSPVAVAMCISSSVNNQQNTRRV